MRPQVTRSRSVIIASLALGALLVASLPSATFAAEPARRVALGISMHPDYSLAKLDALTRSIGGYTPAIWSVWSEWADATTGPFASAMAGGLKARGVVPMANWLPVDSTDMGSSRYRYARIIAGDFDDYIRQWAADAREHGGPVLLRLAPEMNGKWFPWGIGRFDNTAAGFKQMWRHVWGIFRGPDGVGATNVKFLWSPNKPCRRCDPYPEVYPGDAYVNFVGFSSFNWGAIKTWIPMADGYKGAMRRLAEVTKKPVIVAETGSHSAGGDKAAWIRKGYRAVYDLYPRVKGIVYLNVDMRGTSNHPDWRLSSPAGALAAYATIASKPKFQGSIP